MLLLLVAWVFCASSIAAAWAWLRSHSRYEVLEPEESIRHRQYQHRVMKAAMMLCTFALDDDCLSRVEVMPPGSFHQLFRHDLPFAPGSISPARGEGQGRSPELRLASFESVSVEAAARRAVLKAPSAPPAFGGTRMPDGRNAALPRVHPSLVQFPGSKMERGTANEGIKIIQNAGEDSMSLAAKNGHAEDVDALIKARCDPNKRTLDNDTALWIALDHEHVEAVEALLKTGCEADKAQAKDGPTQLNVAVARAELCEVLIKVGLYDANARWKPLKIIDLLLRAGCDTSSVSSISAPNVRGLFLEHLEEQRTKIAAFAGGLGPLGAESVVFRLNAELLKIIWELVERSSVVPPPSAAGVDGRRGG